MRSSLVIPLLVSLINVRLSSPKLSFISLSSLTNKASSVDLSSRIFCNSKIFVTMSLNSAFKLSCSKPVSLPSLNSRIAFACSAESLYFFPFNPYSAPTFDGLQASLPTFLRIASTGPAFHDFFTKAAAATLGSFDFFIIVITSSIFAIATIKPSTI